MNSFEDLTSISITSADLYALPEYTFSLPTGTSEGKRWRKCCGPLMWAMGEYLAPEGDVSPIRWRRAVIDDGRTAEGDET